MAHRCVSALALSFALIASALVTTVGEAGAEPAPAVEPSMDGKIVYQSDAGGTHDVWVMDGDGTDPTRLTQEPANLDEDDGQPSWSGDATRIVFASCRDDEQPLPCALGDVNEILGNAEIYGMLPDGSTQTRLTTNLSHDGSPALSPDGSQIAFVSLRDLNPEIYVMQADGTGQQRRTLGLASDHSPAWSPDGTRIAFVSDRDGDEELFVMQADGTGVQQLTSNTGRDIDPAWSPDGREIAFASDRDGDLEIWTIGAPGTPGSPTKLTDHTGSDRFPAWSPRGREIAFTSDADGDDEIFLMNADGTGRRQVTSNTSVDRAPDWVENVSVRTDRTSVAASPASIPTRNIPLSRTSPNATGAAGEPMKLDNVGLGGEPMLLDNVGLGGESMKLESIGLGGESMKLENIGLGGESMKLENIGLGGESLLLENIGLGTLEGLKRIPLSSLPIADPPPSWEDVLAGTPFAGMPLHAVSLGDLALANDTEPPFYTDVRLAQLDMSRAPFGSLRFDALLAGRTRWRDIASPLEGGWCPRFEALGFPDCGAAFRGLDGTPLHAQIAGLRFDDPDRPVPLHVALLDEIGFAPDAPARDVLLRALDLGVTRIGSIALRDLPDPDAVVDCARVDCASAATLFDASRLFPTAIHPTATLERLGAAVGETAFGEVVLALARLYPFEAVPYDLLGIGGWGGPGSTGISYDIAFAPVGVAAAPAPEIEMRFAPSFVFDSADAEPHEIARTHDALTVTWRLASDVAAGTKATLRVLMRPGARIGGTDVDAAVRYGSSIELRAGRAAVTVTDTFEPNGPDTPAAIEPDVLYSSFTLTGDEDSFALPAPARGSLVTFILAHQDVDRDLAVYLPPDAAELRPLRDPGPGARELAILADEGVGFENATTLLQPDGIDVPLVGGRRLAGLSQNRGAADERVTVVSPGGTGDFLVHVTPYPGAQSDKPYTLRVRLTVPHAIGACDPAVFAFDPDPYAGADEAASLLPLPASLPSGTRTLILFPRGRWTDTFGPAAAAAVTAKLTELASHPAVQGAVIGIDSDPAVRAAYQAWDLDPCDPERSNDVVREANRVVDSLRTPETAGLVLVGDHLMTPFAALRDLTEWGNESHHAQSMPYGSVTAPSAAGALGYLLSDDAWAETAPEAIPGGWLYLPDLATGRLVEDTADVLASAQAFLDSDGVLDPSTAAAASADFMQDLGAELHALHTSELDAASNLTGDAWTLEQLKAAILPASGRPDVAAVQAHSDAYRTLAPGSATPLSTSDVDASVGAIARIWYTMGCHTGELRPDRLGAGASRDWAQTLARRTAVFLGQTGYGLGGRSTFDLSEPIVGDFGTHLLGGAPVDAGQALAAAKRMRMSGDGSPGVYLLKALAEATLFGLPMYRVGSATQPSASVDDAIAAISGGGDRTLQTDPSTGLRFADVRTRPDHQLVVTPEGRYTTATGHDPQATHYRPVLPRMATRVHSSQGRARGVTIESYATVDQLGFDPLIVKPLAAAGTGIEHPFSERADFDFPAVPARVTDADTLVTLLGHFSARGLGADGRTIGRMRRVTDAVWRVWYSDHPDRTPPEWQGFDVSTVETPSGWMVTITVRATDDTGVAGVSALFLDGSGRWTFVRLEPDGAGAYSATVPFEGPGIEVLGQILDVAGNTRFLTNKGRDFAGLEEPADPLTYEMDGPFSPYLGMSVQAGSTVPLRWRLSLEGTPVARISAVRALWSYAADCATREGVAGTAFRESLDALSISGDGLTYHENWQTRTAFAGGCAIFEIELDDDTARQVFFRFKG